MDERQSAQNLSPVSLLGDAEYDAHPGLSAGQRVQLVSVPHNLPASPGPPRGDRQMRLQPLSSQGDAVTAPEGEDKSNGLLSPSSGLSADVQSVPIPNSTARYNAIQHSRVCDAVNVGGGGGCNDTNDAHGTVPLTGGVSVESEPTCNASLVPTVGTNGIVEVPRYKILWTKVLWRRYCG